MLPDDVTRLLAEQGGVVARGQLLAAGHAAHDLQRWRRQRLLQAVHPGVYVAHTGEPTWLQRAWAGVLTCWPAGLAHESAVRAAEGPGRRGEPDGIRIHVAVDEDRNLKAPRGVTLHRLTTFEDRMQWNLGPPRQRYEDALVDVAVKQGSDLAALAVLAHCVQGRRTTAARLIDQVRSRSRVPRRAWLEAVLSDVAAGTHSALEHGYLTLVEKPHGLPTAARQTRAVTASGIVYGDGEYDDRLVVELDGRLFHDSAEARDLDLERDLDAALRGRATCRLSWGQVFDRPCSTAGKVGALLRARGWPGVVRGCAPGCPAPGLAAAG